jgi:hypothetical protein
VLDFEGIGNLNPVGNFYNGGAGTNFGIGFNADALAVVDADAGGSGNFGGEPSPDTILFFLTGSAAIMDVAAGFDTGFSFFYSAINSTGNITVWDGLGGTGNILATLFLPLTPFNGAPDPTGQFSPFVATGVGFAGVAKSVSFAGVQNQIGFDDVTFGSVNPGGGGGTPSVPEPATITLLSSGLLAVSTVLRRRKRA